MNLFNTEINYFKNYKVDKEKINLCCCLISFKPININYFSPLNLSKKIIGNNLIFKILLINLIFLDQLFSFKKRIFIYNFFNKIFTIDLDEKKIILSIINKEYLYFEKVHCLSDFILKFLFRIKKILFRFKI